MDENDRMMPPENARSRTYGRPRAAFLPGAVLWAVLLRATMLHAAVLRTAILALAALSMLAAACVFAGCESADTETTSTSATSSTADTTATTVPGLEQFSDVPSTHPYFMEIADLSSRGIVSGFQDGSFRPDEPVSRQQFAKMIVKTLGLPVTGAETCPFTDVPARVGEDPFYPSKYVAVCALEGITRGTGPTTFSPDGTLSRAQLITMVARAAGLPEIPAGYTPPFGNFSADHYPWARKAYYHGLLDGLEGISARGYAFWKDASRGEASALLYALLHREETP